jgi:hypothetical protein
VKINKITRRLCFFLTIGALLAAQFLQAQGMSSSGASQRASVVMAEGAKGHVNYKIDSQPITELLLSLSRLEEQRGPHCPVVVLIDPRLPIEEIWNIDGTAGKAQFANVRFFVFFRDTGKMSELRRLPAVPFSTSPLTE